MREINQVRRLLVASLLASAVISLSAERPMLSLHRRNIAVAERPHARAIRRYDERQAALRDSIVKLAVSQLGTPYILGGMTPHRGFDCSGLVRYVFSQVHVTPPRTARQQARLGAPIPRDRLRPGDLLTFGRRDSVSHIGIYIGDGKFVHASSVAGRVIVSPLDRRPSRLIRPLSGARRLLASADAHSGG